MKKYYKMFIYSALFIFTFSLVGCGGNSSNNIDFNYNDLFSPIGVVWKWFWNDYTSGFFEMLTDIWKIMPGIGKFIGIVTYILGFVIYVLSMALFFVIIIGYSIICIALGLILLVVWFIIGTILLWLNVF